MNEVGLKDQCFGVEVELSDAKVPYREKIRKAVSVEGKHKKQSGGTSLGRLFWDGASPWG